MKYRQQQYSSKYAKKGFVYILSNKSMPGIYKIGCTSRSPVERASQLCTTGVPTPFQVEYFINIDNYTHIEKQVHKTLHQYNFGKEFFKYDLYKCILEIRKIADNYNYDYTEHFSNKLLMAQVYGKEQEYIQEEKRKKELEEEKRKEEEEKRKEEEKRTTNYIALGLFVFGVYLINSNFGETIPLIIIGLSIYIAVKNNS